MEITKTENGVALAIRVAGCLDTASVPQFENALKGTEDRQIEFDFADLEFISSSAIRALVSLRKRALPAGGSIRISAVGDVVRDVFDMTGLSGDFGIV